MYYPSSQIIPNLVTKGDEYVLERNGQDYSGDYFATSDGKFFTGRNQNDKPNFRIVLIDNGDGYINNPSPKLVEDLPLDFYIVNESYYYARGINYTTIGPPPPIPLSSLPTPTKEDYKREEIQRYFLKKINEIQYLEINESIYSQYVRNLPSVSYQLYIAFSLPWVIAGNRKEAFKVNKKTVERKEKNKQIIGFKSYFKGRFDQFFKYSPNENLYTEGNEFISSTTGQLYQGYYHIHPDKGPMEGRQHIKALHDFLIPVSGSNVNIEYDNIETQSSNRRGGGY